MKTILTRKISRSLATPLVLAALMISPAALAGLDPLFSDPQTRLRKDVGPVPADLDSDFGVEAPALGFENERVPASSERSSPRKTKPKQSQKIKKKDSSRLPSSVSDGFALRVRMDDQLTTFWVVKRANRHDLLFANSSGSRLSVTLSPISFSQLHTLAQEIPKTSANRTHLANCKKSLMQIHVVDSSQPERTITTCVSDRSPAAESIRGLGNTLSTFIR